MTPRPEDRRCARCGEVITGPALFRAGKTGGAWWCAACKDKDQQQPNSGCYVLTAAMEQVRPCRWEEQR